MEALIKLENVWKEYQTGLMNKKTTVLKNLSFTVSKGEIYGYIGHNGAGKTTTLKILMGLVFASKGNVYLFGKDASIPEVRTKIGFLPEVPYFYNYLTGFEFLNFYGQLFGISKKERNRRIEYLLELTGICDGRNVLLRNYSKGMLQRIGIAQALINDPELIILDEPMSGLDPGGRKEIRDIMLQLKKEGKTIFFSTHILSDVEMICDSVGMLVNGELKKEGRITDIIDENAYSVEINFSGMPLNLLEDFKDAYTVITQKGNSVENIGQDEVTLSVSEVKMKDEIIKRVIQNGGKIIAVSPKRTLLETIFVNRVAK